MSDELNGNEGKGRQTTRSRVREYILKQISTGQLKPGERIVETKLAKELSVSQAPVREAILELSGMGLLEERPYSGTFVRILSVDDIVDIYNIRAFIEEYAAKRAAKNRSEEELASMKETLDKMKAVTVYDDYIPLDIEFHEKILDAAHSRSLKQIWSSQFLSQWTYTSTILTDLSIAELNDVHSRIFEFIRLQADHSAGAEVFLHIKGFANEVLRKFHFHEMPPRTE